MKNFYPELIFCFAFTALISSAFAQNEEPRKYCGTTEAEKKFMSEHPELVSLIEKEREKLEKHTQEFSQLEKSKTAGTLYIIPVVFHVLHDYGSENISDEQVFDAIRILNDDYRKLNSDTTQVASAFQPIVADVEIEFRLAQKDPNGNCTNGIDRIWTSETYRGASPESKLNIWPRNKYLNIWTAKYLDNGAAGYSQLPPFASQQEDGIMVLANYVGSIGTSAPYKSRTLTHEAGHWLNLYHTWGPGNDVAVSTNCNIDDGVTDTPNTIGQFGGCNTGTSSCGANDNVQNYMNYADCSIMFTEGQKTRMRAALTSGTAQRNNLWTPTNLNATGVNDVPTLCAADFYTYPFTVCAGQSVKFVDESYNGQPDFWQWDFTGATPSVSNDTNPTVTYSAPGTYNITFTAGSGGNTFTKTKNSYITVLPAPGKAIPYSESFETNPFPGNDWSISNSDNSSYKWDLKTGAGATGTKCLKMNNYLNDTIEKDELISSTFDLSNLTTTDTLKFKVAYCQRSSITNDKLTVYFSTNCGQTWAPRFAKNGSTLSTSSIQTSAFTPTLSSQWKEFAISITSAYFVENFRMKFVFESDGGNNLYLDDINITAGSVGINEDISNSGFIIYPNPNDGNFELQIADLGLRIENSTLKIYNILGNEVYSCQIRNQQSEIRNLMLPNGIYFLKIETDGFSHLKKLIVNK